MHNHPISAGRVLSCLLALALLPLATPPEAAAQSTFEGTFEYDPEASDDVHAAIDEAVAEINFLIRRFARGRLRNTNQPYESVRIAHTPSEILIATNGGDPVIAPRTGEAIRWTRADGEVMNVKMEWVDGGLRQTFIADDGARENFYRLGPAGETMRMTVTITSDKLPEPLTYTLAYRRAR